MSSGAASAETGTNPAVKQLGVHVVAREKIDAIESVAGNEALDFVERGERIEGAEFGLEAVGFKPDGVPVGLAGLRAARLAEIAGGAAFAERNERADVDAHSAGESNEDFEVGFDACAVCGFADNLDIAEGVGDGAGFFVEAGGGENNVSESRGLGEEKILHDEECVGQCGGREFRARDRIGADDKKRAEIRSGVKHLRERFASGGREVGVLCECTGSGDGDIAGKQIGEEAHVGCAAGVGVVAKVCEAGIITLEAPCDEIVDGRATKFFAEDDD